MFTSNANVFNAKTISGPKFCTLTETNPILISNEPLNGSMLQSFLCKNISTFSIIKTPGTQLEQCDRLDYLQDGYCDDITNTKECLYDGGDCCCQDADFSYCSECNCFATNVTETCWESENGSMATKTNQPPCIVESRSCNFHGNDNDSYYDLLMPDPFNQTLLLPTPIHCLEACQNTGQDRLHFCLKISVADHPYPLVLQMVVNASTGHWTRSAFTRENITGVFCFQTTANIFTSVSLPVSQETAKSTTNAFRNQGAVVT